MKPVLYRLKVKPDEVEEKTAGGIIIPENTKQMEQTASQTGTVIALGETVFEGQDFIRPGDRILYAKYAGVLHVENGIEYRFMNDEDVIGFEKKGD